MTEILAIIAVLIGALFMVKSSSPPTVNYDVFFQKWGSAYNVDWRLLKAIAWHESDFDPNAVNPSDPSIGLMQILCSGYTDKATTCTNTLYVNGWPPPTCAQLFNPDYNVEIGAQIMASNIANYGYQKAIAVYNDWSARNDPPSGPFRNQAYVDDVNNKWQSLINATGGK